MSQENEKVYTITESQLKEIESSVSMIGCGPSHSSSDTASEVVEKFESFVKDVEGEAAAIDIIVVAVRKESKK